MKNDGLKIDSINGDFIVQPVQATHIPEDVGIVDMVLVAVKSFVESGTCYGIASKIAVRRAIEAGILKHINIRGESIDRKFIIAYHPKATITTSSLLF